MEKAQMTEHTELLTDAEIDQWHEGTLAVNNEWIAKLCAQAKANVGAGVAVAQGMPSRTRCEHGVWAADYCYRCGALPAAPSTAQEAMPEEPSAAIDWLRNGQIQADMDGSIVNVSRQALEETLTYIDKLRAHCLALKGKA
jgi:hypothetical protein